MVGIYKITSPIDISYIGQSFDINKRFGRHKDFKNSKLKDLNNSFVLYGFSNHTFEVLYELPKETSQTVLDEYECFYINQFREAGKSLFNIKDGGHNGKHSSETCLKIGLSKIGNKNRLGQSLSQESRDKISKTRSGKYSAWNKGKEWDEEAKKKMSKSHLGKPTWNKGVYIKLSLEKVLEIKYLLSKLVTHKVIALQFGISQAMVSNISTGKMWNDV